MAFDARPRILNVDDDDDRRRFRTFVLGEAGFAVTEAGTAHDALAQAQDGPDLILLDVLLPDTDGFDVCRRLKGNAATAAIPVLHISAACLDDDHYVDGLRSGGDGYLGEPVSPKLLVETIRVLIRRAAVEATAREARDRAEAALQQSEHRYRTLFEHAPYGIFQATLDGRLIAANRAFARIVGHDSVAGLFATGSILGIYANPGDRASLGDQIEQHGVVRDSEALWTRADGSLIRVRLSSRRIPEGYETFVEDITERQRLEEQLQQSQRLEAIGRVTGSIVHDFNNILTVVLGYADLLVQQVGTERPIGRDLNEIRHAAEHAAVLTRQLLTFARRQPTEAVTLDLNQVVETSRGMLQRLTGETIALETDLVDRRCLVKADPGQLQQVLLNLVINARDAMASGGTLLVRTTYVVRDARSAKDGIPIGRYCRLSVSDTGAGMDEATLRRLFQPFFTTKHPGKGTGLGLATVYGIVKQAGGHVRVQSAVGRGTRFDLYFPESEEPAAVGPEPVPAPDAVPARILVVEDDPEVRALTAATLERHGHTVTVAGDAREALALDPDAIASADLLLTDVVLPFMSGAGLAKRLRARNPNLRVLFMSGYLDRLENARPLGGPLLLKPFVGGALLEAVGAALQPPVAEPS